MTRSTALFHTGMTAGDMTTRKDFTRTCTQIVTCLRNPETGEKRLAKDGCVAADLRKKGWISATGCAPPSSSPSRSPEEQTKATTAGQVLGPALLAGVGAALTAFLTT